MNPLQPPDDDPDVPPSQEEIDEDLAKTSDDDGPPRHFLYPTQQAALEQLLRIARCQNSEIALRYLRPRTETLVIGPSGVGKSHLIRQLARELRMPYFRATVSEWRPRGVRNGRELHLLMMDFISENAEPCLIHIDEVDKLKANTSDWSIALRDEVMSVLDRTYFALDHAENDKMNLTHRLQQAHIVCSGTWHDVWGGPDGHQSIGFGKERFVSRPDIRAARTIPAELLNRLCLEHVILPYMTHEDFASMISAEEGFEDLAADRGIVLDIDQAVGSGLNMRWLEAAALKVLMTRPIKPQRQPDSSSWLE